MFEKPFRWQIAFHFTNSTEKAQVIESFGESRVGRLKSGVQNLMLSSRASTASASALKVRLLLSLSLSVSLSLCYIPFWKLVSGVLAEAVRGRKLRERVEFQRNSSSIRVHLPWCTRVPLSRQKSADMQSLESLSISLSLALFLNKRNRRLCGWTSVPFSRILSNETPFCSELLLYHEME